MSLADDMVSDLDDVFLDEDDFAETGTYEPKGGQSRSITWTVADDGSRREPQAHHNTDVRTIRVLVKRDADEGVDTPRLGDRFVRDSEPTVGWDFQSIVEARPGHYVLQLTSRSLNSAGNARPPGL